MCKNRAAHIKAVGIVQGTGFRPFVHRIASKFGLKGYIRNLGGSEVEIWVEGDDGAVELFLEALEKEKPPPVELEELKVSRVEPRGYSHFTILESAHSLTERSQIPPDIGACPHCLRETIDPTSRWFRYPFNSCAWCGPRFSMMYCAPYDRENTSMRDFPLCDECRSEYSDPGNLRRFHAQGISCTRCGPRLRLLDNLGVEVACDNPLSEAVSLIEEGNIVAIKGIGGFHLAALASDDDVVMELRRRKQRPRKPFALMALDLEVVKAIASPSEKHLELLSSPQKPIVLVPKRVDTLVSSFVAPGLTEIGVMLPYTPLHYLLLSETKDKFLIMTSGNRKGLPICKGTEALRELSGIADYFLVHNREIVNRVDDSVIRLTAGEPQMLRRSRGYVPRWVKLPFRIRGEVIALGAHLDNTGAIAFEDKVVPTQYLGDMDNLENIDFLLSAIDFLVRNYRLTPSVIASDKHPNYLTTEFARRLSSELGVPHVKVQHHHAHIVSCTASNGLQPEEEVVGVAMDGVGYGDDGHLWGGEVLLASYTSYERVGHLDYLPLPGGDRATLYPVRITAAALSKALDPDEAIRICLKLELHKMLPGGLRELEAVTRTFQRAPVSSSVGRFLDAVSALLGVCTERTFEGEPAIKLEAAARGGQLIEGLKLEVSDGRILTIDFLVQLSEARNLYSVKDLAYTTLTRLGEALASLAREELKDVKLKVAISGGAAVNDYIVYAMMKEIGEILLPRGIPAGDGGISLGQAVVAGLSF
ncbi:MAG: carbamoyltransferase HypF [Thermofilaceae archaeon]|nr:carbamoyltransferase HypF [Thermofilaceae archaeon]